MAVANAVSKSLSTVSSEYRAFLDLGEAMVRGTIFIEARSVQLVGCWRGTSWTLEGRLYTLHWQPHVIHPDHDVCNAPLGNCMPRILILRLRCATFEFRYPEGSCANRQ